jgi:uncharacterized tellurite resistance protein B-like protein
MVTYRNGVVTMFGSLKTLISSLVHNARLKERVENDCLLAIAALLIRVATVDREMSEARREKIRSVLTLTFELDDFSAAQLLDDADAANRSAIDLYRFTRQLNDAIDEEGRRQIVGMMWEVVYVDGCVSELENNVIWRAADLLAVTSRQRIALRQRVAAEA